MKLDLKNVLWRTRGRHWDYSFVLRPLLPLVDSWYEVHVKVFAGISPDSAPVNRGGILVHGSEKHPFVATAFQDAIRQDAAGRPVANYIIWFPNFDRTEAPVLSIPAAWGKRVVSSLGDAREKTFDVSPSEMPESGRENLEEVFASARDLSRRIVLDGAVVPVDFDTKVVVEKKSPGTDALRFEAAESPGGSDPDPGASRAPLVRQSLDSIFQTARQVSRPAHASALQAREMIERAILEGEAYALDFKGTLDTAKVFLSGVRNRAKGLLGRDSEILHRLARSFGGAPWDTFIGARVAGIHRRVSAAFFAHPPRPGFDALVEALRELLPAVAAPGENTEASVARLLGASVDDQMVRNVVARLVALGTTGNDPQT